MMRTLFLLLSVAFTSFILAEDIDSRPARNDHPRVLFGAEELAGLRQRLKQPGLEGLMQAIQAQINKETDRVGGTASILYDSRVRDYAILYAMTGEEQYADQAWTTTRALLEDEEFWQNPGSKGLTRAYGVLSVALAYDLCAPAWPEDRNRMVSEELFRTARWLNDSMGAGANNNIANNWQAVRYSTVIVAGLASDEPGGVELAKDAFNRLVRHLKANLGPSEWNPEGIGYLTYPWTFTGPAGMAAVRAGIGDLREEVPQTRETLWTQFAGTVAIPAVSEELGLYPDLSDDNPRYSSRGSAGLSFFYLEEEILGAARYAYDMLFPGQTYETMWGGGLYTWLLYPLDREPKNPAEVGRRTYRDPAQGLVIFRNQWKNEKDIVALVNATERRAKGGHSGPDVNTFRIIGLGGYFVTGAGRTGHTAGQTNLFASPEPPPRATPGLGKLVESNLHEEGDGNAVVLGSCMGVEDHLRNFEADYSERTGFPAVFLNSETSANGTLWRLNTPEFNRVEIRDNQFWIHSPNGSVLHGVVLEPAAPTFRTGKVERGGGAGHTGFPYRGEKYIHNTWLEMDVNGRAAVVLMVDEQAGDPLKVEQSLHGAELRLGDWAARYDRAEVRLFLEKAETDFERMTLKSPLPLVQLDATPRGDREAELSWQFRNSGAESLRLERAGPGKEWQSVAELEPGTTTWMDSQLEPSSFYRYRIVQVNRHGESAPSPEAEVETWSDGVEERTEDFAPPDMQSSNRLGNWTAVDSPGPRLEWNRKQGSDRDAEALTGFWSTGSVPIRHRRVLLTEDVNVDLSAPNAQVRFDIQARATTVFSPIFRRKNGSWVMAGRRYVAQRNRWKTLTFDLQDPEMGWWEVYPYDRRRSSEKLDDFDPASSLQSVTGTGIFVEWVINQKTIALDQFTLRGSWTKNQPVP